MDELKPCPFCGCTKLKIEYKSQYAGRNGLDCRVELHTYSVRCNVCHARGGSSGGRVINDPWTHCVPLPDWATTDEALKERATEAWNRRTDPVVHGRWIDDGSGIIICPECERGYNLHAKYTHYCPNCGVKMDGGESDVRIAN